jgi:hypothetical protein
MSTTIYNAYKVNGLSLDKLINILSEYADNEWINSIYPSIAIECMSRSDYSEHPEITIDDVIKNNEREFCVVVYSHDNNLYVQFFHVGIPKALRKYLEDFHYQDQVDPWYIDGGSKYTEEQLKEFESNWKHREDIWNKIFKGSWTPSECGLSYYFKSFHRECELIRKVRQHIKEYKEGMQYYKVDVYNELGQCLKEKKIFPDADGNIGWGAYMHFDSALTKAQKPFYDEYLKTGVITKIDVPKLIEESMLTNEP